MRISPLECPSCDKAYALWRTLPRTEGASAKLVLLCGCEGRAVEVCVKDGRLAMREFPFEERGAEGDVP